MDLSKVSSLLTPVLEEMGYSLYSIKQKREDGQVLLEVIIDRVQPINMEDIVDVTNKINEVLDEADPIEETYTLDVSSLGAEKPLKIEDLSNYVGSYVHVKLINPIEGENILEGDIETVDEKSLSLTYKIKTRTKRVSIDLSNIKSIRLAIKF